MKEFNSVSTVVNHPDFGSVKILFYHVGVNDHFHGGVELLDPRPSLSWLVVQVQKYLCEYNNRSGYNHGNMYFIHDIHVNGYGLEFSGKIKKIADYL